MSNSKRCEAAENETSRLRDAIDRAIEELDEQYRLAMMLSAYDGGGRLMAERFERIADNLRKAREA